MSNPVASKRIIPVRTYGAAPRVKPWLTIWTEPRYTIRWIIDHNPTLALIAIAIVLGIGQVLDRASTRDMGDTVPISTIIMAALVMGPIAGVASLYVGSAVLTWTARWLGGSAPITHVRVAMAWGSVPMAAAVLLWLPALLLWGREIFTTQTPRLESSVILGVLMVVYGLVAIILNLWGLALVVIGISEVQRFTPWQAGANLVLSFLALIIPIGIIAMVLVLAVPRL